MMNLLGDIKKFISKYIKNPVVVMTIGFLIWKVMNDRIKKDKKETLEIRNNHWLIHHNGPNNTILQNRKEKNLYIYIEEKNSKFYMIIMRNNKVEKELIFKTPLEVDKYIKTKFKESFENRLEVLNERVN